jgi:predicted nucleic acid-binding protein
VIAYVDSSLLVRFYLSDEPGHQDAVKLLRDPTITHVTGTLTRIEVSGALVRAARSGRGETSEQDLLKVLDADLAAGGRLTELTVAQADVERKALELVRRYGLRALDTWHLAIAFLTLPALALVDEEDVAFASRDQDQAGVAEQLGFKRI